MAILIRTFLRDFNNELLVEELTGLLIVSFNMQLAGFEQQNRIIWTPIAARKLVSRKEVRGVVINETFADPGEVWIKTETELSAGVITTIDSLLTSHDVDGRTSRQTRRDQDDLDVTTLETALQNWDSLTSTQRNAALKLSVRLGLRRYNREV